MGNENYFIEIKDLQGHIHFIRRGDILRMRMNSSNGIYTIYYSELSFDGKDYLVGLETRQVPILIDGIIRSFTSIKDFPLLNDNGLSK